MFGFLFSPIAKLVGAVALGGAIVAGIYLYGYRAGAAAERLNALETTMEQIRERSDTNEEVSKMDDAELCAAIGGVFEDGQCR